MQTVFRLRYISQVAKDWMAENIQVEPWQRVEEDLVIEHRYVADIVAGMFEAGFLPHRDFEVF